MLRRTVRKLLVPVLLAGAVGGLASASAADPPVVLHGLSVFKGCESPVQAGDKYECSYGIQQNVAGDTAIVTSVTDTTATSAGPMSSGNILSSLVLTLSGGATCNSGQTSCTIPAGGEIRHRRLLLLHGRAGRLHPRRPRANRRGVGGLHRNVRGGGRLELPVRSAGQRVGFVGRGRSIPEFDGHHRPVGWHVGHRGTSRLDGDRPGHRVGDGSRYPHGHGDVHLLQQRRLHGHGQVGRDGHPGRRGGHLRPGGVPRSRLVQLPGHLQR